MKNRAASLLQAGTVEGDYVDRPARWTAGDAELRSQIERALAIVGSDDEGDVRAVELDSHPF